MQNILLVCKLHLMTTHEGYEEILKLEYSSGCIYVAVDLPDGLAVDNDKNAEHATTNALHKL